MKFLSFIGTWLPVFSINNLEYTPGEPQKVKILNRNWVVWKDNLENVWSMQEDICPHKFAPLSQGRVEQKTGCIECPYHGWQFDTSGKCSKIPQNNANFDKNIYLTNIVTYVTGDLLWGFFPESISSIQEPIEILPDLKYSFLNNTKDEKYFMKELPYSWDILVENFMDPAHIPFAHHGLQGKREDGKPINITLKNSNLTHCEIFFEDTMNNKPRKGILSFHSPTYFSYSTLRNNEYKTNINVLTVPVKEGSSRVFMISPFSKTKIPTWLQHAATNRFLNTDIWLHDAEINYRNNDKPYLSMSSSDKATSIFRRWWTINNLDKTLPNTFSAARKNKLLRKPRNEQINSWNTHSKYCKDCKNAKKFFKRIKFLPLFFSSMYVFTLNRFFVYCVLLSGFLNVIADKAVRIIEGETYVNTRSVAAIKD